MGRLFGAILMKTRRKRAILFVGHLLRMGGRNEQEHFCKRDQDSREMLGAQLDVGLHQCRGEGAIVTFRISNRLIRGIWMFS